MPELKSIKSISEKKWFFPLVLILLIVIADLVIYINLVTQLKVLNARVENLETTIQQLSGVQGGLGLDEGPVKKIITPEGGVTTTEGGAVTPEGEVLAPAVEEPSEATP